MKKSVLDMHFVEISHRRITLVYAVLLISEICLFIDNLRRGETFTGLVALFCAITPAITLIVLYVIRPPKRVCSITVNISVFINGLVYLLVFGWFMISGGNGGTSIFLVFMAAPVAFYFFNFFCGSIFCSLLFIEIIIFTETPLRNVGFVFPEIYYQRLPIILFLEIVVCALAQFDLVKARIRNEKNIEEIKIANEAKSDFLANTSHEMRTPLNAMMGFNELILRDKNISRVTEEYSREIMSAGQNLLDIINDILDISRIEAGRLELVEDEFTISSLLSDISAMADTKNREKGLRILINADCSMYDRLCGDVGRIRQVASNLISNAIKYTPEGAVVIDVSLKISQTVLLEFKVRDTGIGIRREDFERIFQSFSQVDMKRNRQIGGTGLGLTISRHLADLMRGTITVDSEYGKGSVFTFSVPVQVMGSAPYIESGALKRYNIGICTDIEDQSPAAKELAGQSLSTLCRQIGMMRMEIPEGGEVPIRWKNLTHIFVDMNIYNKNRDFFDSIASKTEIILIADVRQRAAVRAGMKSVLRPVFSHRLAQALTEGEEAKVKTKAEKAGHVRVSFAAPGARALVVDDNKTNNIVMAKLLRDYRINSDTVNDGYEGISMMESVPYDIIFMDHMMPGMDGIETVKTFHEKGLRINAKTPVVALTANAIHGMKETFIASGFRDYLSKPVEIEELERVLKTYLADYVVFDESLKENDDPDALTPKMLKVLEESDLIDLDVARKNRLDMENIRIFSKEYERSRKELTESYKASAWDSYRIRVHALKSSSKMVGAVQLSALAEQAEEASGKAAPFDELHLSLLSMYDAVISKMSQGT